ncbi:hypothetical protein L208DRAFT_1458243 [Tricholoma matsutake]|nr:hypothetical protein L208DRAFT_1458243 [Tricholoma matsutake 945]
MPTKPSSKKSVLPAKKLANPSVKSEMNCGFDLQASVVPFILVLWWKLSGSAPSEVLEGPASPVKKRARKTPPPPGTEAYRLLPAVSISSALNGRQKRCSSKSISEGLSLRLRRRKAEPHCPSEPTVALSTLEQIVPASVMVPAVESVTPPTESMCVPGELSEEELLEMALFVAPFLVISDIWHVKREGKKKAASVLSTVSDDAAVPSADILVVDAVSVSGVSDSVVSEAVGSTQDSQSVAGDKADDVSSEHDDSVMLSSCQDAVLVQTYNDLPHLLYVSFPYMPCLSSL